MPAKPTNALKVTITLQLDAKLGEWVASCQRPDLHATGLDAGQARERLKSLLEQHHGEREFAVVEKIILPKDLQDRVDSYQRDLKTIDELREKAERERLPLAKDLQRYGLQQKQAAELVGLSATWLGNMLKRAGTGQIKKPGR
jgi:predicted RNase H-like HicB family nuclease